MAETFTLYKLIVLYMLDRVDFPLTTSQISEFILDKVYNLFSSSVCACRINGFRTSEN